MSSSVPTISTNDTVSDYTSSAPASLSSASMNTTQPDFDSQALCDWVDEHESPEFIEYIYTSITNLQHQLDCDSNEASARHRCSILAHFNYTNTVVCNQYFEDGEYFENIPTGRSIFDIATIIDNNVWRAFLPEDHPLVSNSSLGIDLWELEIS